tara:strand:- start:939 stop:1169 length:231 start_codon:yes stop_codon:yes gene_type:complete
MSNFIKIVRNYENIYKLGHKIINHKDLVKKVAPNKLDEEFRKQENRIQEFVKLTEKANEEWEKNPHSVNTYWTGLS